MALESTNYFKNSKFLGLIPVLGNDITILEYVHWMEFTSIASWLWNAFWSFDDSGGFLILNRDERTRLRK